jgi:hypothetical protein
LPRKGGIRRYPFPSYDPEQSSIVKLKSLEFFVFNEGWHTAEELREKVLFEKWQPIFPLSKAIPTRFLRYTRSGLLERRRRGHHYEYAITMKGEKRWIYFLRRRGLLEPEKAKTLEERNLVSTRREAVEATLEKHKASLEEKLRMSRAR